jgi:bacterioferritin (cytochrome b1)
MKGNSEVVQHLNKLLANEQTAFHQYLLQYHLQIYLHGFLFHLLSHL